MAAHPKLERPKTDADRLREQASVWRAKAEWHTKQRRECVEEAWALEADADRLERETPKLVAVSPARTREEHDAEFLRRLADFLERAGEAASSDVADALDVTQTRARTGLARLEAIGLVLRSGLKRGTRYRLAPDDDDTPARPTTTPVPREATRLRVLSSTHPTPAELQDREVVHVTEEPA